MAAHSVRRGPWARVQAIVGFFCVVVAAALGWHVHSYETRSATAAANLLHRFARDQVRAFSSSPHGDVVSDARSPTASMALCRAPAPSSPEAGTGARMVLAIPAIGLLAPVLPGTTESELSEGVGHLRTSSWPDQGRTDVLEAHDVTFFARLDKLRPGDAITLRSACHQWTYRVSAGQVVSAGAPVVETGSPTLVLVTCWPTDALYFTNQRFVVTAAQVAASVVADPVRAPETFSVPALHSGAGLSAWDVSVDAVGTPEGTLAEGPGLSPALVSSAAALHGASTAMGTFDTGLLAAERVEPALWSLAGPTDLMTRAGPLADRHPVWRTRVALELGGDGTVMTSADIHAQLGIAGRAYRLAVHLNVVNGYWQIDRWDMSG